MVSLLWAWKQAAEFLDASSQSPVKAQLSKSVCKVLLIIFSDTREIVLSHMVPAKTTINSEFCPSVSSLSFIFLFLPCLSLSSPLLYLLSLFSLSLGDNTKWSTRVDVSLNSNRTNNSGPFQTSQVHFASRQCSCACWVNLWSPHSWAQLFKASLA